MKVTPEMLLWLYERNCCCYLTDDWATEQWADHNSTPDSIRAAAVVAIVRALGYQERNE